MKKFCLLLTACCLLCTMQAIAVPQYLNYQGILRGASGNLITGTKAMKFRIYDDATATAAGNLKLEVVSAEVVVSGGLYNVGIGPLGYAELASGPRWLEVEVGGETLSPRTELLSVAYAVMAVTAETAAYANTAGSASTASSATNATTATNANYATLSGTASSAESVRGPVSAEAGTNPFALFVRGKIGITGEAWGAGYFATAGDPSTTVPDSRLTPYSIVFGSVPGTVSYNPGKTYIYRKGTSQIVCDVTTVVPSDNYPFYYVIIN